MNSTEQKKELARWIRKVIANSPRLKRGTYRAELEDHYWDKFEEGRAEGMTEMDAHRHALARLGNATEIRVVWDISRHHHWRQAFWSIAMPNSFWILMTSVAQHPENIRQIHDWLPYMAFNVGFPLILLVPLFYTISSMRAFLEWAFQAHYLEESVTVILVGLVLTVGVPWWLQYLPGATIETSTLVCQFGMVVSVLGMVKLCADLTKLKLAPRGIRGVIQASFIVSAAILICPIYLTVRTPDTFYLLSFPFVILDYFVLCLTLGTVFLHASTHKPKNQAMKPELQF